MLRSRVLCLLLLVLGTATVAASPLPPGARARLGTTNLWHGPAVQELAFAPDGKTFFSLSSADSAARQWDAATGAELRTFAGHKGQLTAFALSRDGRLLATAGNDRTVRLWNTATGEVMATWPRKLIPTSIAFAPDSKALAVLPGDETESVAVLDAVSGKELHKFKAVDAPPFRRARFGRFGLDEDNDIRSEGTIVFSPDGRFLAVHVSQMVTLWDTTTHKRVRRYEVSRMDVLRGGGGFGGGGFGGLDVGGYVSLQFSADSQTLLAGGGDGGVLRWEIASVEPLEPLKSDDAGFLAVAERGGVIAAAGSRGLTLWNGDAKRLHQLSADSAALTAVACSPDGKTAVTGDRQGRLRVWDVATGKERLQPGPRPVFRTLAVTDDGVVSADEYALVRWNAFGKETKRFKLDMESTTDLLLSPDGLTLAVRGTEVILLDAMKGEIRGRLSAENRKLTTLQFSADSRWLAAFDSVVAPGGPGRARARARLSTSGTVSVYDARTGKEVRQLAGSVHSGDPFVFLLDGRTLVTAASDDSLCLWETLTGKPRRVLPSASAPIARSRDDILAELLGPGGGGFGPADERKFTLTPQQLAVSPDGRIIAAVQRTTVSLVDLRTGKRLARLEGHTGSVSCVAYSPDGRLLVTGGNDQLVHLWDGVTGKEIGTLSGHRGPVRSAVFAPNGKTLVTAAEDQTALVWDVAKALETARQASPSAPARRPLEELWTDLAGDDAEKADAALRELESRPAEVLPLLKERLRPATAADAKQVAKWVAELDDDDFAVRERAAVELEKTGEQARAALEAALKNQPSKELKRRVTEFLKKLDDRAFSAELVRDLRALEALETIGSEEAVKILEALATGAASDPRTQDAKTALERLKRK